MHSSIFWKALGLAAVLAVSAVPQGANAPLGIFESRADIGTTPKHGSVAYDPATGNYMVTGGGANIWANEDAFYFLWKRVTGDVSLDADISFVGAGTVAHRKAVLMIRQDLTPGAAYADVAVHGDGLTSLQFRPKAGGPTQEVRSTVKSPGGHLRIERRGNQFTVRAGDVATGPQEVELSGPVYIGIGMCSHDANLLETAVFSKVRLEQIPLQQSQQTAPAPRPAGQRQQAQYRSKVTIFDLATRSSRVIHQADTTIEAPNWSRDGMFLLVNSGGSLYRLSLTDGKMEKIEVGDYRCNNDHDLSRDGKWLAFSASSGVSRSSQVYLAHADGSGAKLMTPATPSYFHGWSPDGNFLAFVGQRNGKFELFKVGIQGGREERLTSKGGYDDGPEYTPDGKWIYFNSNRNGGWDIWRIPADGAGKDDTLAERVTSDELEDWFPHISPNGKQMLVFSFPKGTENHGAKMAGVQLRLMPAPGKKVVAAKLDVLTTFYGGQGTINVNSWSPDSRKFAYVVYEPLP